jgi:HPr kinase/phosphorylase
MTVITGSLKQVPGTNNSKGSERIHGVLVSVQHVGVLIIGKSGIGKSECALELITRHHKLVADDLVITSVENGKLFGKSDPLIKGYMELHGLGVIKVQSHFGKQVLCSKKRIDMVIDFIDWDKSSHARGFLKPYTYSILGEKLPLVKLPVRPARNMASLVEVAVTSFLLKKQGIDEAKELERRISERIGSING